MKLNIGTVRSDCAGFNSIAHIAEQSHEAFSDSVEVDFSSCDFFEANMAAPLYVVVARLRDELNDVSLINLRPDPQKKSFPDQVSEDHPDRR